MNKNSTVILDSSDDSIKKCADLINNGEVVGIPTETVYGLAGDALNPSSIKKIFLAKGRPQDNPLIVHISDFNMIYDIAKDIPKIAYKLAEKFWPGPLTMVFNKKDIIPIETSGGLDTVGIRMPAHKVARKLIEVSGKPLAAPSANISGLPSPTTAKHVHDDLDGTILAVIDGGICDVGVESTVISFEENKIRLLRPGFISAEDLSEFAEVVVDKGVENVVCENEKVASPGMKYKHYSPKADVAIIDGDLNSFINYVEKNLSENTYCVVFDYDKEKIPFPCLTYGNTSEENAKELFGVLRELDEIGAKRVFFRSPQKDGVGLAVYNRLLRAAGYEVIKV